MLLEKQNERNIQIAIRKDTKVLLFFAVMIMLFEV
jgi:hypothetical protein